MWWFRRTDPSHAPCERAEKILSKIIEDQRAQIAALQSDLLDLAGVGVTNHKQAQRERAALHELELERLKRSSGKGVPEGDRLDLDSVLVHDIDKSVAVESFAPARRTPDPESVADE